VARRNHALRQLRGLGLEFEFLDAVDGASAARHHFDTFDAISFKLNARRDPLPGEIGCYASHRRLWQVCAARNEPILVLEDDFKLLPGFAEAIPAVTSYSKYHDFLRLGPIGRRRALLKKLWRPAYEVSARDGYRVLYLSDVPTCLTAYAINPRGANRLLAASRHLTAPVDKFLQQTWQHRTPVFALHPAIVRPAEWATESTIGRRSRKSNNPALLLARALYKGVGELRRLFFDRAQLTLLDNRR
jgi:glycosyl transferase family 25